MSKYILVYVGLSIVVYVILLLMLRSKVLKPVGRDIRYLTQKKEFLSERMEEVNTALYGDNPEDENAQKSTHHKKHSKRKRNMTPDF